MEALERLRRVLPMPFLTLSVPFEPETLNRMMQAATAWINEPEAKVRIPNYRVTVLVEAGGETWIPFPLPQNWVCTRRAPIRFESDYYSRLITVDVYCDGAKVNPYPMPLDHPFEVDFGAYYVKRHRVDIYVKNDSDADAHVTFHVVAHLIRKDLYDDWYEPLTKLGWDFLTALAEAVRSL